LALRLACPYPAEYTNRKFGLSPVWFSSFMALPYSSGAKPPSELWGRAVL